MISNASIMSKALSFATVNHLKIGLDRAHYEVLSYGSKLPTYPHVISPDYTISLYTHFSI